MTKSRFTRITTLVFLGAAVAMAANTVEGSLTANGDVVPLRSVVVDPGLDQVGLLMTAEPVPAACGVYDAVALAQAGRLRGMAVSISRETHQIEPAGLNALYHESWKGQVVKIGTPEIRIDQFDEKVLKGSIHLAAGSAGDNKFSYDASFQVELSTELTPIEAKVSGAGESPAAQAYAEYYTAMMAGRLEDGKKYVIEDTAKQMTGDDAETFLEYFQEGHPHVATITAADENGNKATLSVQGEVAGCMSSSQATAKVQMVKEGGVWKVSLDSWTL